MNAIKIERYNGHIIAIVIDECAVNPVENSDMLGTIVQHESNRYLAYKSSDDIDEMLDHNYIRVDIGNYVAYCAKDDAVKEYGHKILTAKDRIRAESVLRGELVEYIAWAEGRVYGYQIYADISTLENDIIASDLRHAECLESCYGYYGCDEMALTDAKAMVDSLNETK